MRLTLARLLGGLLLMLALLLLVAVDAARAAMSSFVWQFAT